MWLASMARGEITLVYSFMTIATLKTRRKLGRVNFCKDFWGCYWEKGKKKLADDRRVPSNDPRNNCGTHFSSSPLLVSKVANSFTLSLAHCIVCSITAGNDFSVQWGTSSSGGSRLKRDTHKMITNNNKKLNNSFYYINTNEIPGELSRENLISSHVKISPLLWLHNKSRLSHQKTIKVKWFGISLVFI